MDDQEPNFDVIGRHKHRENIISMGISRELIWDIYQVCSG